MEESRLDNPPSHWKRAIEAASRENDPRKLRPLVTMAEDAIFNRLQELAGKKTIENEEILRAVATLREIQVSRLGFPRWDGEKRSTAPEDNGR